MKVRIVNKSIVADGSYIELKIIKTFDNNDDKFPYVDVYCVDDLSEDDTDSVLIAKTLNRYYDCNFEIEYLTEEIKRDTCHIYENVNILIYKDYEVVMSNYIDNHLCYDIGLSEDEIVSDWRRLGVVVEFVDE